MTSSDRRAERATTFSDRLRPRNWSLPVRLIAVLLVPTLLALGLGALLITDQTRAAESLSQAERFVAAQEGTDALLGQLQSERDQSAVFVANERSGDVARLRAQAFAPTDAAAEQLRRLLEAAGPLPDTVVAASAATEESLRRLPELRTQVTEPRPIAPGEVIKQYTAITQPVLLLADSLARQLQTAGVAELAGGLSALASIQEQVAQQHALIATGIIDVRLPPADIDQVRAADARLAVAIDDLRVSLTPEQQAAYGSFLTGPNFTQFQQLEQTALTRAAANQPVGIPAADWDGAYGRVASDINSSETGMRGEVKAASSGAQDQSSMLAIISLAVLLLALLIGLTIAILVGRTLLKSLRTLRRSALDVAERRLPQAVDSMRSGEVPDITIQPVPVTSQEEVGQVARAFDAVHGQAVRLAAEQATLQSNVSSMFVNLSRRSQGLVERQLQLIEQLESNEEDPEQLSNLFQLDHLATRMRRNSENLLVLAGSDLARRGGQPVPVVDVLRAAVSEVEQYQRIVVQPPPPVRVLGRAASDLVHLLAELLDNATIYSAPESQVVMSSSRGEDGSVLVEIADRGIGMSEQDLADANARLNGPPNVDVSAARRMGLFVVGRLAARHGIAVHLTGSSGAGPGAGVTASVTVPNYLVTRGDMHIPEAPAGSDPRAGAGDRPVTVPPPRPPGNGASRGGSFSSLVADGSPRPGNGVANGHGKDGPAPDGGRHAPAEGPPGGGSPVPAQAGGAPGDGPGRPYAGAPGAGSPASGQASAGPGGSGPSGSEASLFGAGAMSAGAGVAGSISTGSRPPGARPPAGEPPRAGQHATDSPAPSAPPSAWAGGPAGAPAASPPGAEPAAPDDAPDDAPPTEAFGVGAPEHAQPTTTEREPAAAGPSSVEPETLGAPPVPRTDPESVRPPEPPPADDGPTRPETAQGWPTVGKHSGTQAQQAPMVPGGPVPAGRADALGFVAPPMAPEDGSETTPIFEEIASAWFRSKRPVPVDWQGDEEPTEQPATEDGQDRPAGPTDGATAPAEAVQDTPVADTAAPSPAEVEPPDEAATSAAPEPAEPDRQTSPEQVSAVEAEAVEPAEAAAATAAPEAAEQPAPEEGAAAAEERPEPARPAAPTVAAGTALSAYAGARHVRAQTAEQPAQAAQPAQPAQPEQPEQPEAAEPPEQPAPEPAPQEEPEPQAEPVPAAQPEPPEQRAPEPAPQEQPEPQAEPVQAAQPEPEQPQPGPRSEPAPEPETDRDAPSEPPPAPQRPTPSVVIPALQPIKPPEPHWPERPHEPAGFGPVSRDFAGPADAGWHAAQALGEPEPDGEQPEQITAAGLPKRKPRARLVPGSAETSEPAGQPRRPSRTAEQVRGRLARYQAGIRQGREERHRRPDNPAQLTDEEQR